MSDYHTAGQPDCVIVYAMKKPLERTENGMHGAEVKQNSIHGADWNKEDKKTRWQKMNSMLPI